MTAIDPKIVDAALLKVKAQVDEFIAKAQKESRSVEEFDIRLHHIEQHVAGMEGRGSGFGPSIVQSMGLQAIEALAEGHSFKALKEWNQGTARATLESSIKAALVNEDGASSDNANSYPSQPERRGAVGPALPTLRLIEALPSRPVSSDAVEFVQVTVDGDAAEQVNEGDAKQEIEFDGALVTAQIATIAAWTSASRQVLDDKQGLAALFDRVFRNKTLTKLEDQLINSGAKINGLIAQSTPFVPSVATTAADIIGEALAVHTNSGYRPSLVLMNPLDFFALEITKSETAVPVRLADQPYGAVTVAHAGSHSGIAGTRNGAGTGYQLHNRPGSAAEQHPCQQFACGFLRQEPCGDPLRASCRPGGAGHRCRAEHRSTELKNRAGPRPLQRVRQRGQPSHLN